MKLLTTDYILGIVGVEMIPPAEDPTITAMTICFVCFRRTDRWITYIEFLYSRDSKAFSAKDNRSIHTIALPDMGTADLMWETLRQCARESIERLSAARQPKEFMEYRVDGTPEKLSLMLATSPDAFLHTFLSGNLTN